MSSINNEVKYTVSLKDLMSAQLDKMRGKTDQLDKSVDRTKNSIANLNNLAGSIGLGLSVGGIVSFGRSVVESLKNYEYFSASLRTLMLGDAQAAKSLETSLVDLASKTPFSLTDVQDATKQLLAYGFSAGTVTTNIRMLGDVASALKIPFQDIAYLYGTLKVQGRAYTRDIMQFTQRGIPIIGELAKQFGVTEGKVRELVEAGKVGFPEVERAFKSMTAEGGMFFNMMEQQSKTVGGQISNLGDNWEQLKVRIGKSQQGIISETVTFMNQFVSVLSNGFRQANIEEENFAKYGAKQFKSVFNPASYFEIGSKAEQLDYQRSLYAMYVDEPAKTMEEAVKRQTQLSNLLINTRKAYNKKEINETEFSRKRATIYGALDEVKGQMSLLKKKPGEVNKEAQGQTGATSAISAATTQPQAPKYTQIHIRFDNVVKELNLINNTQQDLRKVADKVVELITMTVNDSQRMALQ